MTSDPQDQADDVFGRGIVVANVISREFRRDLLEWVTQDFDNDRRIPSASVNASVGEAAFRIARHLVAVELASYLAGFLWTEQQSPRWLTDFTVAHREPSTWFPPSDIGRDEPPTPPIDDLLNPFGEDAPEPIRYPEIEEGVKRLRETNLLTRDQFDAAAEDIQQRAFTVAGDIEVDTIGRIRDTLANNIDRGTSLEGFRNQLDDKLKGSFLGPAHLETVYRTNTQAAFRDGRQTLMSDPIVAAAFPYQRYIATHDDRVRESHLQLESLGLDGTDIYRMDDPFWDRFTPPWDYNCRCSVIPLSLEAAAEAGVSEARRWLETGVPPRYPEHRFAPGSFPVEPNVG